MLASCAALPRLPLIHIAALRAQEYLNSTFYYNSFLHHAIHQDNMGASYLNPYPIMEPNFCETVGAWPTPPASLPQSP